MPHDFDQERRARLEQARTVDRSFRIGGETFERRPKVHPEALLPLDRMKVPTFGPPTPDNPRGDLIDPGSSRAEDLAAIDAVVLAHIDTDGDPTAEERYLALRARKTDPLDFADLYELMRWLTTEEVGRPTGLSADSTGTPQSTGTSSTDGSSQPGIRAA